MTLSGKKALVTGAAGGIGQAIVKALTDAGAAIAATDFQLEDIPCNAAKTIRSIAFELDSPFSSISMRGRPLANFMTLPRNRVDRMRA